MGGVGGARGATKLTAKDEVLDDGEGSRHSSHLSADAEIELVTPQVYGGEEREERQGREGGRGGEDKKAERGRGRERLPCVCLCEREDV